LCIAASAASEQRLFTKAKPAASDSEAAIIGFFRAYRSPRGIIGVAVAP
jgi:hypothetical protein